MKTHPIELNWIHHIQNALQSGWTDSFFILWDFIDSIWFLLIFVATIMYLFNRKEGISLLFLFILSGIVNILLKTYFHLPRPCQMDPSVGILCYNSYGFPSGAAQTATLIAGIAFAKCRRSTTKVLAGVFALFLCFSRIYLGLHFFTDILGGIVVGICLLLIYLKVFPFLENHWGKFALGLSALLFFLGGPKMLMQAGMTLGIAIGLFLSKPNLLSSSRRIRLLTFFIVILGSSFLMYFGEIHPSMKLLATIFSGLWFIHLGSYLVEKVRHISS